MIRKIALFIVLFTLPALHSQDMSGNDTPLYRMNPNYDSTVALFEKATVATSEIVMLGNSITHGGKWKRLLNRSGVEERGVPGDILEGFVARVEQVIRLKPKICFIMGGINDIYGGIPVDSVFSNYKNLVEIILKNEIRPIIQSVLFAGRIYFDSEMNNKKVLALNNLLLEYAKKNEIDYIDLNKKLSIDNFLKEEVTTDGVHLNRFGYKLWAEQIEDILRKYSL